MRSVRVSHRMHRSATRRTRRRLVTWSVTAIVGVLLAAGAVRTGQGQVIAAAVDRFLLFYAGVFALLALTAVVVVGLAGTDRNVLTPGGRILGQTLHRALTVLAVVALATHVVLEVAAGRSRVVDAFVPFEAHSRTLYIGMGTIASDLVLLIVVTSLMRGRFATRWPLAWRIIHVSSYAVWLLSIVHGLLAGRTARPYVDWSYGACVALVGIALAIRLATAGRLPGRRPATSRSPGIGGPSLLPVPSGLTVSGWDRPRPRTHALAGRAPRHALRAIGAPIPRDTR